MNTQEAWYMVGYLWGVTLVVAYIAHATFTTRWAKLRAGDGPRVRELQVVKSETASVPSAWPSVR